MTERVWECKIGGDVQCDWPKAADGPMREAVQDAFKELTGVEATFTFSGWGAKVSGLERSVIENRVPTDDEWGDSIDSVQHNARRYERLRILGAAPGGSKQLSHGTVLRFQNLDEFVDKDLKGHPSRGEYKSDEPGQLPQIGQFNKIVPVKPDAEGRIVAEGPVLNVFDTNSMGELLSVMYRQNPMDAIEVKLVNAPFGQVYVLL